MLEGFTSDMTVLDTAKVPGESCDVVCGATSGNCCVLHYTAQVDALGASCIHYRHALAATIVRSASRSMYEQHGATGMVRVHISSTAAST